MRRANAMRVLVAVALVGALSSCGGGGDGLFSGLVSGSTLVPIPLPDNAVPGSEYPSTITLTTPKTSITATAVLVRLTHERPRDVDLLLVGPGGETCLFMADCFDATSFTDDLILFDHSSTTDAPNTTIPSPPNPGPYRATNHPGSDVFPGAPAGPYGSSLSVFVGTNPNGDWRLYAIDDAAGGIGTQVDAWGLWISAQ